MESPGKVMIVEDDLLLSIVAEKLVTKLGYEVVGKVQTGEAALSQVQELDPDILIMDIQLGGLLNGVQTVEILRERQFKMPVIFLSGDSEASLQEQIHKLDYVDFLMKPVSSSDLELPLQKATEELSLQSQNAA